MPHIDRLRTLHSTLAFSFRIFGIFAFTLGGGLFVPALGVVLGSHDRSSSELKSGCPLDQDVVFDEIVYLNSESV